MSFAQKIGVGSFFKKIVIVAFFIISGLVWLGMDLYSQHYVSTEDAYVNANVIQISPRLTGKVAQLYINNNQYVNKDQPLFDLDDEPFTVALSSAAAQVEMSQAQFTKLDLTAKRIGLLVKQKYASTQNNDDAIAASKIAYNKLQYVKTLHTQALLNLKYTKISAPANGWLTNVSLRSGDIVSANQPLFALVSNEDFWVDANFKETEIADIKPGQVARVVTDLYPHHVFKGVVESISSGTGAAFSLLPPQNATGNWVKVTQRIPVRVRIINPDREHQLRIGTTATVTINKHVFLKQ